MSEVISLDEHRLLCGNAQVKEDVDKLLDGVQVDLLLTDPPYGIDIVKPNGTVGTSDTVEPRLYKPVIGDDKPFDPQHLLDLDVPTIIFGAKPNTFSDCELAWTNLKGKAVSCYHHTWFGMIREGERRLELKERVHPTQKPVGLLKRLIEEYCPPNGVVLDLYGGSGSTLIACAETGRTCYMMELSKDYVEIIQERYWNYRDKEQRKLI